MNLREIILFGICMGILLGPVVSVQSEESVETQSATIQTPAPEDLSAEDPQTGTQTPSPSEVVLIASLTPSPVSSDTIPAGSGGTPTPTAPPVDSDLPTATQTPTSTDTRTPTTTPTPTPTSTSTPGIVTFSLEPKPLAGRAMIQWEFTLPVDQVVFKVYTSGYRCVVSERYTRENHPELTAAGSVVKEWDVRDDRGKPLPPGTYYFYLTAKIGRQTWEARDFAQVQ
jgi:hypothetical protein